MSGKFPVLLFSTRFITLCWSEDKKKMATMMEQRLTWGKFWKIMKRKFKRWWLIKPISNKTNSLVLPQISEHKKNNTKTFVNPGHDKGHDKDKNETLLNWLKGSWTSPAWWLDLQCQVFFSEACEPYIYQRKVVWNDSLYGCKCC